jgi:hypothetical protein
MIYLHCKPNCIVNDRQTKLASILFDIILIPLEDPIVSRARLIFRKYTKGIF